MILTGPEIKRNIALKRIIINPFDPSQINPNSYNYRLGSELICINDRLIDPKKEINVWRFKIPKHGYILRPKRIYLSHTFETIGSDYYVTTLLGRSTVGRLGLWLQVTSDLGHIGTRHNWTLELKVVQPLKVYAGMEIGQVSFWKVYGNSLMKYQGKYAKDMLPQPSRIKTEF